MKIEKYAVITPEAIAKWLYVSIRSVYGLRLTTTRDPISYMELFKRGLHAYRKGVLVVIEDNVPNITISVSIKKDMPVAALIRNLRELVDYVLRVKMCIHKYTLDIKIHS